LSEKEMKKATILSLATLLLFGCGKATPPPTLKVPIGAVSTPKPIPTPTNSLAYPLRRGYSPPLPTITPMPLPTVIHVVQRGDTLIEIARQYGVSVSSIQEANAIADPRLLQVGQELIIPLEGRPTLEPSLVSIEVSKINPYETPVGSLWFLGEVENTSGANVEGVRVVVSLYDEDSRMVATESSFTELNLIPPGDRAPFAVLFTDPPRFREYAATAQGVAVAAREGAEYQDLEAVNCIGEAGEYSTYIIKGEVKNLGQFDAESVVVVVTAYDAQGRVVAIRDTYAESEVIPAGGSSPFTAHLSPAAGMVVTYTVQVRGRRCEPPG